ncbi:hypothetical protein P152DRAFT_479508 [Eremomyces bilateralis CBS 781.70]|uniref:Uncharacterized protein n=1 Tax=Eremomyces bilateralis CBS 781.70 TaxID=1392243 RepID=A0A6G1GCH7_9PEZI|nr:uncharacterized protein P152DRAFT_479508 [Eremomyces bilateralis CBS 781.70]KAF1815600.1 hypothetical protein P152DRAFT_479508 [Eremomyces bilateralis CBS 781.70]
MADKSKQSSSTGSAKRALSKPVLTRLSTIRREVEELLKFSDGILDYENICTKLSALEQETAEKHQIIGSKEKAIEALQKEVVKLRTEKGLLKEEFIAGYEKWKGESKRREDEVASLLQEELGLERRKCESTSQQLRQLRAEISKYKKRYDKDQDDIVGLKHDLEIERLTVERITANFDNCKREVEELQSQIGILNFEQSQIESTFSELDGTVHKLAWHCFHQKIPDPCVVNIEAAASSRRILQVPSNTEPALCMRSAIAEAIISQALCKYIFKPFYLSKSTDTELAALVKALDWLSTIQPDRADIVRYQIASVFDVQQETDSISGCAMQFVLERLDAWLTSQNKEYFSRELTTFFGNAIEIWKQLQKGPKPATFQADLDTVGWNFEDHGRPEYDKRGQPGVDLTRKTKLGAGHPIVSHVEND